MLLYLTHLHRCCTQSLQIASCCARLIFTSFASKLTAWIVMKMLDTYQKRNREYDIEWDHSEGDFGRAITNKSTGDTFLVSENFECKLHSQSYMCGGRRCWQQVYTGALCIHSLTALVDRVSRTASTDEKLRMCRTAIQACHKHWYRASYTTLYPEQQIHLPDPSKITSDVIHERRKSQNDQAETKERFNALLTLLTTDCVNKYLCQMEREAMQSIHVDTFGFASCRAICCRQDRRQMFGASSSRRSDQTGCVPRVHGACHSRLSSRGAIMPAVPNNLRSSSSSRRDTNTPTSTPSCESSISDSPSVPNNLLSSSSSSRDRNTPTYTPNCDLNCDSSPSGPSVYNFGETPDRILSTLPIRHTPHRQLMEPSQSPASGCTFSIPT